MHFNNKVSITTTIAIITVKRPKLDKESIFFHGRLPNLPDTGVSNPYLYFLLTSFPVLNTDYCSFMFYLKVFFIE